MNYTCVSDFTYFDSPDFLSLAFHITSLIEAPIHCLGFYCILFKTPEQMKTAKWYLFTLHSWILIFDFSLSLFAAPYLLITEAAGYPLGFSKYTGIPLVLQFVMVIDFGANMAISVLSIFESRFYIICTFSWKQSWTFWRRIWLAAHYIIFLLLLSVVPFLVPDQQAAVTRAFKNLPCMPKYVYEAPIFVVANNKTYHILGSVIAGATVTFEVFTFLFFLFMDIGKQLLEKTMSQKTFQLQKRFVIALIIQIIIPLICCGIPLIYTGITVVMGYFNQAMINILIVTIASHGIASTIAMLLLHKPYRHAVKELCFKPIRKSSEVSVQPINNYRRNTFVIAAL